MSILIKGLNMPKGDGLVISIEPNGEVYVQTQEGFSFFASKAKAVEVPTPHGRLIDAEALSSQFHKDTGRLHLITTHGFVSECIEDASTVIEAEGEHENRKRQNSSLYKH